MFIYIHIHLYVLAHNQDIPNSKNWEDLSYDTFKGMLTIGQKSKINYEYLSLLTKRQWIMWREKKNMLMDKKRKKHSLMKSQGLSEIIS